MGMKQKKIAYAVIQTSLMFLSSSGNSHQAANGNEAKNRGERKDRVFKEIFAPLTAQPKSRKG